MKATPTGSSSPTTLELERIADAGFAGLGFSFVDYAAEFSYFRDEVLPRLEARGLR